MILHNLVNERTVLILTSLYQIDLENDKKLREIGVRKTRFFTISYSRCSQIFDEEVPMVE